MPINAVHNAEKVSAWLDKQGAEARKAYQTAIKVEGYRLMRLLRSEIKKGSPGGRIFKTLTHIAKRMAKKVRGSGTWIRQNQNRKPLAQMATAIRYDVKNTPFSMAFGFVGPIGNTWRRLAKAQQEGFTRPVTKSQRKAFARRGAELGTVDGGDTPFFLRKSTTSMTTPARPIITPFWQAHQAAAERNIRNNFRRKMAGNKI